MTNPEVIFKAAQLINSRVDLAAYYPAVVHLRGKGLAWREIADFFRAQGVETDHSKLFRMFSRMELQQAFVVPPMQAYVDVLKEMDGKGKINASARAMLECHFNAHNRTVTYTELAEFAQTKVGKVRKDVPQKVSHKSANLIYGTLGRQLGEKIGMRFAPADERGGFFYSSSIGLGNVLLPAGADFQIVMHHELAKALVQLGWFLE